MNISFDIETTGKKPGCGILTIAAVPFDLSNTFEPLYLRIKPESNVDYHLFSDQSTCEWWMQQDPAVRAEAWGGTLPLKDALYQLQNWYREYWGDASVWGYGAIFDLAILNRAFDATKVVVPWSYKKEMCLRTLAAQFPHIPKTWTEGSVAHNALDDASNQALHCQKLLRELKKCLPT